MDWEHWIGEVIDGKYPLHRFIEGDDIHGVFLTGVPGERQLQKAFIKLSAMSKTEIRATLARWAKTADLSHPHLVNLHAVGQSQLDGTDLAFMVTEFPDDSLSEVLSDRALTEDEAREFLKPALDVLAYLHGKGFAHTAVRPANLFAVQDQLKLSRDTIRPIGDRGIPPTAYTPPELSAQGATPAGDAWSLGVTLVEVLTQRPPDSATGVPGDLPTPFLEIARNCLAADPDRRWTIAKIGAVLDGGPSADAKPKRPLSMAKTVRIAAVVVFGVVLTGVVVRPWLMPDDQTGTTTKTTSKETPDSETTKPATEKKDQLTKSGKSDRNNLPPERALQQAEPSKPAEKPVKLDPQKEVPARPPAEASRETAKDSAPNNERPKDAPKEEGRPAPAGDVVNQVLPEVRPEARRTIRGKVAVGIRVRANASGDVVNAAIDSRGPSWYFADLALDAAKKWKFAPASGDATREWVIQFQFQRASTKAGARRTVPSQ